MNPHLENVARLEKELADGLMLLDHFDTREDAPHPDEPQVFRTAEDIREALELTQMELADAYDDARRFEEAARDD